MIRHFSIVVFLLAVSLFTACSDSETPPVQPDFDFDHQSLEEKSNAKLLGMWEMFLDVENSRITIEPSRDSSAHFNITTLIPAPQINILSIDPVMGLVEIEVVIENSYSFDAFDARMIIYTDPIGHMLENPDGWTDLFDIPDGLPINPFRAFNKDQPSRIFAGLSQATENLTIYLPGMNPNVQFAFEASFPGNCSEPYLIDNFTQTDLYESVGAEANFSVDVFDWQDDVLAVYLYCPVLTGVNLVPLSYDSGNLWTGTITNANGQSQGIYSGFIVANSGGVNLYEAINIIVSLEATDPGYIKSWGGGESDRGYYIHEDDGYLYISGTFEAACDFDPGSGDAIRICQGYSDGYVSKFSVDGTFLWVATFGGLQYITCHEVTTDDVGNVFVVGGFQGQCDFDPGPGGLYHNSQGGVDAYLLKLDSSGNLVWVQSWGRDKLEDAEFVVVNDTNIYVYGYFNETADMMPGPGELLVTSNGGYDFFVSKFDIDGNFEDVITWGSENYDFHYGLVLTSDNRLFATGTFEGECDFDPGSGVDLITSLGGIDSFISEFDSSLSYLSVTHIGGIENVEIRSIVHDSSENLYVGGLFSGEIDFDPTSGEDIHAALDGSDCYVSKYDASGRYELTCSFGGLDTEVVEDIAVDYAGNIILAGLYQGTCDFDPGQGILEETSNGNYDLFLMKLTSSGDLSWYFTGGSSHHDRFDSVDVDPYGYAYATGAFQYTVDFEPGPGVTEVSTAGSFDVPLLKVKPNGLW